MSYPKNRKQKTIAERFFGMVEKRESGCWEWIGATSCSGYGVIQRGSRGNGLVRSHRFSYELHHGPIPEGKLVMHSCNNKICVNPDHLSIGSHSDNLVSAWKDNLRSKAHLGRIGDLNRKLNKEDVLFIRNTYTGKYGELKSIALKFGVSKSAIHSILCMKTWRNI